MQRIFLPVIVLIIYSITLSSCQSESSENTLQKKQQDSVSVFSLNKVTIDKAISFPGELVPFERTEVFAKVSGYVSAIKVDMGDFVRAGQVVAILEAPEMLASYAQANAEVQTAKARFAGSQDAYNRIISASKVEGTIAIGEKEKIKNQMWADSSVLEAAKARLNAYTQLKDYLVIKAPFSGIVTQRNVDVGTLVGTSNSKPMLIIENTHKLRLRLPVPEAYISATPDNASTDFTVDAYPGVHFKAQLTRKSETLNLQNRTETWEFIYNNMDKKLKPGMFANATIQFKRSNPSFVVPSSAIVTTQEKRFVIRIINSKAQWVDVRNGFSFGDRIEIFGDLTEGDMIVARGNDEIKPEQEIKLIKK